MHGTGDAQGDIAISCAIVVVEAGGELDVGKGFGVGVAVSGIGIVVRAHTAFREQGAALNDRHVVNGCGGNAAFVDDAGGGFG